MVNVGDVKRKGIKEECELDHTKLSESEGKREGKEK